MANNMTGTPHENFSVDALLPRTMAQKAEDLGVLKANLPLGRMFALPVLAGAFIALGAALRGGR